MGLTTENSNAIALGLIGDEWNRALATEIDVGFVDDYRDIGMMFEQSRDFRSRQRSYSFICSQDGVDRHGARARLRIRAA